MKYDDQKELIRAIIAHVAGGGQVAATRDDIKLTLGWKDEASDAEWIVNLVSVKQRRFDLFGDLIVNDEGRSTIARCFNHGHPWTREKMLTCNDCIVHHVMTS